MQSWAHEEWDDEEWARHRARRESGQLAEQGRIDQAIAVLRPHADSGDGQSASVLAALLVQHDRLDELRQRAAAGDHIAGRQLAHCSGRRQVGGAGAHAGTRRRGIELMRSVAHEDETAAMRSRVLLGERGRVEEAAAAIRRSPRPLHTLDIVYWQLNHDGHPFAAEAIRHAMRPGN